jgi:hypothetical protein
MRRNERHPARMILAERNFLGKLVLDATGYKIENPATDGNDDMDGVTHVHDIHGENFMLQAKTHYIESDDVYYLLELVKVEYLTADTPDDYKPTVEFIINRGKKDETDDVIDPESLAKVISLFGDVNDEELI